MEKKNLLTAWLENFTFLFYLAFVVVVFLQVIFRYLLNHSLTWAEEFARYSAIWMVFLAGGLTIKRGSNLAFDLILNTLPFRLQQGLLIFNELLIIVFLAFLAYTGWGLVGRALDTPSPAMQIPLGYIYLAIPLGSIIMILYQLSKMLGVIRKGTI